MVRRKLKKTRKNLNLKEQFFELKRKYRSICGRKKKEIRTKYIAETINFISKFAPNTRFK